MECEHVPYSYVLQRCGPGVYQRVIQLNQNELGTLIGRAEDNITLNSLYVSRQHLQICFKENKWKLIDQNSFNNTFVYQNGITTKMEPFVEFEIFEEAIIGLGVHPITWQSKEEYMNDGDFFVYRFTLQDETAVNKLCEAFKYQVDV